MSRLELGSRSEAEKMLQRPLNGVSDFVVEEIPQALNHVRLGQANVNDISLAAYNLVSQLSPGIIDAALANPVARDLAGLDLKMLEAGIVHHSGGVAPTILTDLVDVFAGRSNQPTGLSYEEIVLVNPRSDMRLFTDGDTGETERRFYLTHKDVESHLEGAIFTTTYGIGRLVVEGDAAVAEVAESLKESAEDIGEVGRHTQYLGDQNAEHFKTFRNYLNSHPVRGKKGPSGAFTAGVPTLEILIAGRRLPEERRQYLSENAEYFPRAGRENIARAQRIAAQDNSLISLSEKLGHPDLLVEGINNLSRMIRRFRGKHYRAVRNQVPEALSGEVAGTGGEQDSDKFLRGRMEERYEILK